jgi:hypothetical protein
MLLTMGDCMRHALIGLLTALAIASCSPDPNEQANKLFVQAQQLIEKAQQQKPDERLATLQAAEQQLKAIVTKYPAANLAVQLASGQSVGTVSLKGMSEAIAAAAWEVCVSAPKRPCVIDQAGMLAHSIKDAAGRASVLVKLSKAQAKAGLAKEAETALDQAWSAAQLVGGDRGVDSRIGALIAGARQSG